MSKFKEIVRKLTGSNERTWLGHGLQGFVAGVLGESMSLIWPMAWTYWLVLLIGAFGHREGEDFIMPALDGDLTWKESFDKFLDDGVPDFFSPWIGFALGQAVVRGLTLLIGALL